VPTSSRTPGEPPERTATPDELAAERAKIDRAARQHRRPPLRLADAADVGDTRAEVARALLDRLMPVEPPVDDAAKAALGYELADAGRLREIHADPRYLIGRLAQALTMLLQPDLPPMDATAELLADAITDAAAYRRRCCPQCPAEGVCSRCAPDWERAARYEALHLELGLIDEWPQPRPRLEVAR
jgi:hypothetical protein